MASAELSGGASAVQCGCRRRGINYKDSGRLPADQRAELVMRSRGRAAAVAVGGHVHAEIDQQTRHGADADANHRKNGRCAAKRGERPKRMAGAGCSVLRMRRGQQIDETRRDWRREAGSAPTEQ